MSIGANIKKIRLEKKIKQIELASKLGVSASMIAQYESGHRIPKVKTIAQIAFALDVELIDLLDRDEFLEIARKEKKEIDDKISFIHAGIKEGKVILIEDEPDPNHPYNIVKTKLDAGEKLTPEEKQAYDEYIKSGVVSDALKRLKNVTGKLGETIQGLYSFCEELNDDGQKKVLEHAEMIAKIPEYRKGTTENTEE